MIDDFIKQGIINPEDIENIIRIAHSQHIKTVFVDASFVLPDSGENTAENFRRERLPDAVFFDIEAVSNRLCGLPHMLPDAQTFSAAMSDLGISKTDVLIIYGQHGMIMGPARVWWMMRGFGHERVVVLNGGLPAWKAAGLPIETTPPRAKTRTDYTASSFHSENVITMENVQEVAAQELYPILDARPTARFNGTSPEPRAGMRSGHIPSSLSLPCKMLVHENGRFKSREDLIALFKQQGLQLSQPSDQKIILTCGSGITACALGLALFTIGQANFSVYDGSWSEWGRETASTPVATNVE